MSRSAEEIRQLQAKVYGRDRHASQADVGRLSELMSVSSVAPAPDTASTEDGSPVEPEIGTPREEVSAVNAPRRRSYLTSPLVLIGTFVLALGVGVLGGLSIADAMPAEPVQGIVPPAASMFYSESITYYGEIDGVRVWTGNRIDEGRQCLIALSVGSGTGGFSCAGPPNRSATVHISSPDDDRPAVSVTMDFSNTQSRPAVNSSP